ncbi:hypothetical protein [Streptomyces murinus]|uniref:hypothetical protein n=1 Tax=Streptomyces murinus TaxID=33900 RepID=UPI000A39DC8B|nr:hypothetical protein [Streptomyces murinus]
MQRKAYVTGTAALLAALLAGCSGGSGGGGAADDANPGDAGTATVAAQPGRYRTLPEPCGAVSHGTLDALLPGIKQIADPDQRDKAYQGEAELTYDTDRKVGCRWKVPSADSTDRLSVDLERVVSYDNTVSDDDQARELFEQKETAADLPVPSDTPSASTGSDGAGASPSGAMAPELQPRTLSDLGDEAYLDDKLGSSGGAAAQRTVTVVFRTSNVVVTIQYEEQPMAAGAAPDSKEMQDRARNLAAKLDDALGS